MPEAVQILHHHADIGRFVAHYRTAGFAADTVQRHIGAAMFLDQPQHRRVDHIGDHHAGDLPLRHRITFDPRPGVEQIVEGEAVFFENPGGFIQRPVHGLAVLAQGTAVEGERDLPVLLRPDRPEHRIRPVAGFFHHLQNPRPHLGIRPEILAVAIQHPAHRGRRYLQLSCDLGQCHSFTFA